jgi:hypothetical protein
MNSYADVQKFLDRKLNGSNVIGSPFGSLSVTQYNKLISPKSTQNFNCRYENNSNGLECYGQRSFTVGSQW